MVLNNDGDSDGIFGRVTSFLGKSEVKYFVGGMVAAYALKKFSETETAHNLAVNTTAGILDVKDGLEESIENIKEDAEDIHSEAQEKQQIEVFGPEDLDDLEEDDEE